MNIKKNLTTRNVVMSVLNVLLIFGVTYGFMAWLQGRKQK